MLTVVACLSNDVFLMVSGSDATSFVLGPPFLAQAAEVAAFGLCLLLPARAAIRAGLVVLAVATGLLAGHRLVIDGLHGEIRDVYLLAAVQALPLDLASEGGLSSQADAIGFRIRQVDARRWMRVVSPPVVGLDRDRLAAIMYGLGPDRSKSAGE